MLKKTILFLTLLAGSATSMALPLTGKTLEGINNYGSMGPSTQAVVGSGVEYTSVRWANLDLFSIDIDETGLVEVGLKNFKLNHNATQIITFTDIFSNIREIIGFDFVKSEGVSGIDQSDLFFTADSFSLQLGKGASWSQPNSSFFQGQLRFSSVDVPEPSTLSLFALGLLAMGYSRKVKGHL